MRMTFQSKESREIAQVPQSDIGTGILGLNCASMRLQLKFECEQSSCGFTETQDWGNGTIKLRINKDSIDVGFQHCISIRWVGLRAAPVVPMPSASLKYIFSRPQGSLKTPRWWQQKVNPNLNDYQPYFYRWMIDLSEADEEHLLQMGGQVTTINVNSKNDICFG